MEAYFDSSILVKAYCPEPNSSEALDLILAEAAPLSLTHLQEAEIRNALRLKVFRQELSAPGLKISLSLFDEDIRVGRLARPHYDLLAVYRRAELLSSQYSTTTGARTLDILHVAAALELGLSRFVSFDQRLRTMAKKAGLKVIPRTGF